MGLLDAVLERVKRGAAAPAVLDLDFGPDAEAAADEVAAAELRLNELRNKRNELDARVHQLGVEIGKVGSADRGAAYLDGEDRLSRATLRAKALEVQEELEDVRAAIPVQELRLAKARRDMSLVVIRELRPVYRRLLVDLAVAMKVAMAAAKAEQQFRDALTERGIQIGHLFPTPFPKQHYLIPPPRSDGGVTNTWIRDLERDHGIRFDDL